ncbi:MAG: DUF1127 domain-containing protein [Rhodocyclaceae bacterium]|nr:DUF1127 domain-containing protein [Rhodocyclaceae bacterium]
MQLSARAFRLPAVLRLRRLRVLDSPWLQMRATLRLWARRRRGRRELRALDERILRDVGLSRSQADFEGGKPFWRA